MSGTPRSVSMKATDNQRTTASFPTPTTVSAQSRDPDRHTRSRAQLSVAFSRGAPPSTEAGGPCRYLASGSPPDQSIGKATTDERPEFEAVAGAGAQEPARRADWL